MRTNRYLTKQQKGDEDDSFGFNEIQTPSPTFSLDEDEQEKEKVDEEEKLFDAVEDEVQPESTEDGVYKGAQKIDINMSDEFEDPLDKPAFMRKMFKSKKKK